MPPAIRKFLISGIFTLLWPCLSVQATDKAASFTLLDQHDQPYTVRFPHTQKRIIIVADRDSAPAAKTWGQRLGQTLGNSVDYIAIAAVGSFPDYLRGFVKGAITSEKPRLLDWDNTVSKQLGFTPKTVLIVIVDESGTVLAKETGPISDSKLATLLQRVNHR